MAVHIPRLACSQDVDVAIAYAFMTLGYESPTREQERAIRGFLTGRDVFVIIPTGSGKSLCFVALPLVFDHIRRCVCKDEPHHSIFIVVSPLTALMKDQVSKYGSSLSCTYIGEDAADSEGIIRGDYQLLYASPENVLGVSKWREMLGSSIYLENLVGVAVDEAHCISTW